MENRYIIFERYQYNTGSGKEWTKWFMTVLGKFNRTEEEAKKELKDFKEGSKLIDKSTKLKHEFEIRCIDVSTMTPPKLHFKGKGRPKKELVEQKKAEAALYWVNHL